MERGPREKPRVKDWKLHAPYSMVQSRSRTGKSHRRDGRNTGAGERKGETGEVGASLEDPKKEQGVSS